MNDKKEKKCQMCGEVYFGTGVSKYCIECRVDKMTAQSTKFFKKKGRTYEVKFD